MKECRSLTEGWGSLVERILERGEEVDLREIALRHHAFYCGAACALACLHCGVSVDALVSESMTALYDNARKSGEEMSRHSTSADDKAGDDSPGSDGREFPPKQGEVGAGDVTIMRTVTS